MFYSFFVFPPISLSKGSTASPVAGYSQPVRGLPYTSARTGSQGAYKCTLCVIYRLFDTSLVSKQVVFFILPSRHPCINIPLQLFLQVTVNCLQASRKRLCFLRTGLQTLHLYVHSVHTCTMYIDQQRLHFRIQLMREI